ncbi:MAG: Eco57I restriction-modification methylase domain-containing protein, partial [Phycisphaerae bacterium]
PTRDTATYRHLFISCRSENLTTQAAPDIPTSEAPPPQCDTDIPVCAPTAGGTQKTNRNLPHWTRDGSIYWVTFRLADSLPQEKLAAWRAEREAWSNQHPEPWSEAEWEEYSKRFGERLQSWLDAGYGSCALARPDVRQTVQDCLLRFNGERLQLHAAVIMPNHVHLLLEPLAGNELAKILKGIKGTSARRANEILGNTGASLWMDESYDHIVRSERQYQHFVRYIAENPAKANISSDQFWLYLGGTHAQGGTAIPACVQPAVPGQEKEPQTRMSVPRCDIEEFIHAGDRAADYEAARLGGTKSYSAELPETIERHARLLDEKLAAIAVCDPAVGSGAFPVGMMQEIVRARLALKPYFNDVAERSAYHFKRHAIQSCLYGVDIDPGAVEIAKLRLWLSLVVDEDDVQQIKPLPNLDYKVVVGNSLLGVEKTLFNEKLLSQLEELKPKYFDETDSDKKHQYKRRIDETIKQLTNGNKTFDFQIYFSEVFHKKGGFDVVIGNPPYIPTEGMSEGDRARFKSRFPQLRRKFDSAAVFILASLGLLGRDGNLTFISSVTWQTGESYIELRRHLLAAAGVHTLVNLPFDSFGAAYVDTGVYSILRGPTASYRVALLGKRAGLDELRAPRYAVVASGSVQPPRFKLLLSPSTAPLLARLRGRPDVTTLGEITESTQGLAASAFARGGSRASQFHLPFAPGAHVRRYCLHLNQAGFTDMSRHPSLIRFYEARPKLLIRRIINRQDRIDAALTETAAVFKKDINPFILTRSELSPRYLLALANSRLLSWLYVNTSAIATKDDFRQTTLAELRELPIVAAPSGSQEALERLVNLILV